MEVEVAKFEKLSCRFQFVVAVLGGQSRLVTQGTRNLGSRLCGLGDFRLFGNFLAFV